MADKRKPIVLIAGGRSSVKRRGPDPMIRAMLDLAGVEKPSVAYVGAASGDNSMFRALIARMLQKAGAGQVRLAPLCGSRASPEKATRVLMESDLVFVSGGDVDEGMRVLEEKGMIDVLRGLYMDGKPFFGASAGSIMVAKEWVRWKDPKDDASVELFPCLGLADVHCDTHGEGEGWEELRALQRLSPEGSVGYGICSGSALMVNPAGSVSALGGEVHRFTRRGKKVVRIESLFPSAAGD
jgi:peptidase E